MEQDQLPDHDINRYRIDHKQGTVLEAVGATRHVLDKSSTLFAKATELSKKLSNDEIVAYLLNHYSTTLIRQQMREEGRERESNTLWINELVKTATGRKRGGHV